MGVRYDLGLNAKMRYARICAKRTAIDKALLQRCEGSDIKMALLTIRVLAS